MRFPVLLSLLLTTLIGTSVQQCTKEGFELGAQELVAASVGSEATSLSDVLINETYYNCLATSENIGTYTSMSVSLTYTLSRAPNTLREIRYVMSCIGGVWNRVAQNNTALISNETRTDCHQCTDTANNEEYCSPCDSSCTGLNQCYGPNATQCCSYNDDGNCVADCGMNREGNSTFHCVWSNFWIGDNCDGAQLSINGTEVASITDRVTESQYLVKENEGFLILNITLVSFPKDKDYLSINYSTIEDTALNGRDFSSTSGARRFTFVGEAIYIYIPIIDNMRHDGKRFFLIGITSECGIDIWLQIFICDDEWEMYGDPHFSVPLLHGGKLCYSIQGIPGLPFNLLSSKHLIINSLFIDSINDPTQTTWIGKLAVILKSNKMFKPIAIVFDSVNQSIKIEGQGYFKPQFLEQVVINNTSSIAVKATPGLVKQNGNPRVNILLTNPKASFDVVFHQDHLDVNWKMPADEIDGSHGLLGQFMVNAVEVDPVKKMLIQPEREPVPVELSKNWNTQDNCWLVKNVGNQGEGLIRGSIYDYIVPTIESIDIKLYKLT